MLVSVNWLKEYADVSDTPAQLAKKITMGGVEVEGVLKVENDNILNLAPTPNRGDCLSVIGVAREVAALSGQTVRLPNFDPPKGKGKMKDWVSIEVNDKVGCKRYTSRIIEGVKIAPSPDWLRVKVESAGLRAINNVVDATNLILLELGQPVHAFDLRLLKGKKLIIDQPKSECEMTALDGVEYKFGPQDIMNLDAERAVGAAGIMGGENSGVLDSTTTLVLESAYFDPLTVRRTSSRTGLVSESSRRFEKGVDPDGVISGLHGLTKLILDVAGGTASEDWIDWYPSPIEKASIDITPHDVNWLLGTELNVKTIKDILELIGCEVVLGFADKLTIKPPLYRPDITRPVDLIEEIARIYGYDKIADSMPSVKVASLVIPPAKATENMSREILASLGFYESLTYAFVSEKELRQFSTSKDAIKLANPLTVDMEYMRTSMIPSLLRAIQTNLNRQIADVRLFEIGKVFLEKKNGLPNERQILAGALTGIARPGQWSGEKKGVDLFDAKAAVCAVFDKLNLARPESDPINNEHDFLHPLDSFLVGFNGQKIGFCGRLHPNVEKEYGFGSAVYVFELNFAVLKKAYLERKISYKSVSRFPVTYRDVAFLLNIAVTHEEILQSFKKCVKKLVQSIELFDIYIGKGIPEGKKSMAYRICFGSSDRTLSDVEVDSAFKEIVEFVKRERGAEVR